MYTWRTLSDMIVFVLLLASITSAKNKGNSSKKGSNWAVLIAGSDSYYNYRHQADVAHAYQVLTKLGGYPKDKVIVMMYNDVVNSSSNPFPGQLFNEPGGDDVYADIHISYSGEQVTAKNFLKVIKGIKKGDTANGPVLGSGKHDNVFIYYSDHGAQGLVAMPTGDPLYATDLNDALNYMYHKNMYSQLVFYLEACESGSMFDGVLSNKISLFATTAASPTQPSYAIYYNSTLSTYMADEYSIRWMQDTTDHWHDMDTESLINQYKNVASIVNESQPQIYGDESFDEEPIWYFEAYQDRSNDTDVLISLTKSMKNVKVEMPNYNKDWIPSAGSVSSRDVKLAVLQNRYLSEFDADKKEYAERLVDEEVEYRLSVDLLFDELIKYVIGYINNGDYMLTDDVVDVITYGYIRPSNYQCLKYVYSKYEDHCERFTDYSLQYVNVIVNLCEIINDADLIQDALQDIC